MRKTALIVRGGWEGHEPVAVGDIFAQMLKAEGYEVEISETLDCFSDVQKLCTLDLIVPLWTMGEIHAEYVKNISQAVSEGTGLAGCHGGMCDAFRMSTDWQFITGAQWVAHPGGDGVAFEVNLCKSSDSSIIEGLNDFTIATEQYYIHVDPAVHVLATTTFPLAQGPHAANGNVKVPVVFTKRWGKGRVFYNALGHVAKVFDTHEAKELMRRGFLWAGKNAEEV